MNREWVWVRLNVAVAVALVGYAALFDSGLYGWFLALEELALIAVVGGVPALAWAVYAFRAEPAKQAWAVAGLALLLWAGATAVADAQQLRLSNCWEVSAANVAGESVWECAPGDSEPRQWSSEESWRACDRDYSVARGSVWICNEGGG